MSLYNEIPYPTHVYPETHPDSLARTAVLFGMEPPPVQQCRVLEIACGDGGNLIPMGFELPNSEFLGIDIASTPIQIGQRVMERSGVKNVTLRALDLMEVAHDFGTFDYIIAHGIYSWAPDAVREKLLRICRDHLSPRGVAFISFNTGPAGRIRQLTRDMIMFHLRAAGIEADQVAEGRKFLQMLVDLADDSSIWKAVLGNEAVRLSKRPDSVTFHDELGAAYSPVYFADFAAAAEQNGLQSLSDSDLKDIVDPIKPEAAKALERLANGDVVRYQQYLDFLVFRGFRRSLLCHRDIPLERGQYLQRVQTLLVASPLSKSSVEPAGREVFTNRRGSGRITTNNPVVLRALARLETVWPRAKHFSELVREIVTEVPPELRAEAPAALAQSLLNLAANKLVDLRTYQASLAESIPARPLTTGLARLQAEEGVYVTTLLHTQVEIPDAQTRRLLQLLDGTRDLEALVSAMMPHGEKSQGATETKVTAALEGFRTRALLVSESSVF
ncbi:MAG TPA: class I SAM-dependent methyltransferase [Bryobacteraceae bacterium]|jgi:methyltransferase-like protein/2-polyprenyl-3-methyl-5-hydroxy-6-metoxy-1,4-benzoquinol methylase|nr:class I SAM-dependent methyltransferase [Bryobacteraceae bacterium]